VEGNVGIVPASLGEGKIKLVKLPNGLQVILFDYILKEDVLFHRKKNNRNFYVIRIDEAVGEKDSIKSALFFSDTSNEWFYISPPMNRIRSMLILFSKEWLQQLLINEPKGETVFGNLQLNTPLYQYEILDSEYRRLFNDVMQAESASAFEQFIVYNRIMLILERFLGRYYRKISETGRPTRASSDELQRLKQVESEILKDFSFTPPNINQLSRMAAMSSSKLKLIFKEVFGMPVYQYYQKHRLQKGKAMLITKKYSIKQVASELGYIHVKDFSKAFHKHFDQLPEELINQ
jgi:AraC-like DNA-binding protein